MWRTIVALTAPNAAALWCQLYAQTVDGKELAADHLVIALGAELAARGHAVAWTGLPGAVDPLLPDGATFLPCAPTLRTMERLPAWTRC